MPLSDRLQQQKQFILNDWLWRMTDRPAEQAAVCLKKQGDRFANPMAHALNEAAEAIYQALVDGGDADQGILDYAIKIKAVQGKDPAEGVAFIHLFKDVIRKLPSGAFAENELADMECRIDQIASTASAMFAAHRHKIDELAGKVIF